MPEFVGTGPGDHQHALHDLRSRRHEVAVQPLVERHQIPPQSGWVEHDPVEIWEHTNTAIQKRPPKRRTVRVPGQLLAEPPGLDRETGRRPTRTASPSRTSASPGSGPRA